jgi:hypothetical protein
MATNRTTNDVGETYRIELDGKWLLKDFSEFFHIYTEVYSLCFSLVGPPALEGRYPELLRRYPWRGGYSAVNFYDDLYVEMGRRYRPNVKAIQYASPGYLELSLLVIVATNIKRIVKQLTKSGEAINNLYTSIHKGLAERKLLRLDVRSKELDLATKELEYIRAAYRDFAGSLHIPESEAFLEASPNPLAALKVLLSLYRRVRVLAKFQGDGRAKL